MTPLEGLAVVGALLFVAIVCMVLLEHAEKLTRPPFELTDSRSAPIDLLRLVTKMREGKATTSLQLRTSPFLATNKLYRTRFDGREEVVGHSHETISQLLRGVVWHEWPAGCPTWTGDSIDGAGGAGCKCDVEEGLS